MDGPNVNWKFLELYNNEFSESHQKTLLNLGSCGFYMDLCKLVILQQNGT